MLLATACSSDSAESTGGGESSGAVDGNEAAESVDEDRPGDPVEDESADSSGSESRDDESPSSSGEASPGVDVDLFFDGALAEEVTTADCTLSDGSNGDCYQITVVGYPTDSEIGPFCPTTTSDTDGDVGIWFDGNEVYDIDGEFILALPEIYEDDTWQLHDDDGNVNVTDTPEAFDAAARPDVDPQYQNHCVEGRIEWLDGGEPIASSVDIPVVPVATDSPTQIRGSVGVTLNGVVIDGQAPVDAILGAYTIAAFDDCGGHVNPAAGYHIHGAAGCSEADVAEDGDAPVFGYALDGFAIHSPLDDQQAEAADLDECNGHTSDASGYHYHANPPEVNAVLSCFMGATAGEAEGQGGRPDGPPDGG